MMQLESFCLSLMGPHNRNQLVCEEEIVSGLRSKEEGTPSCVIGVVVWLVVDVFVADGVRPEDIT